LAAGKDFSRVKPPATLATDTDSIICCPVAGFGILRAGPDQIAALRRNPVPESNPPLALPLLKYSDDQTVAGLAAVYQAIHQHRLADTDYSEWGVVAAPSYLGRAALAATLQRLAIESAWGISPHFIPHHSLHAVSGTISQVLKIHGPNFGIEASPSGMSDALTVAATLLARGELPGLWLVLTDYEPELVPLDPSRKGMSAGDQPACIALALALVPDASLSPEIMLRICPESNSENHTAPANWKSWQPLEKVSALADALGQGISTRQWRLGALGWVEMTAMDLGPENSL
jgi:hypothetical protein